MEIIWWIREGLLYLLRVLFMSWLFCSFLSETKAKWEKNERGFYSLSNLKKKLRWTNKTDRQL